MPLIETKGAASAQGFGEFATSSEKLYIESCFSTYLYTGNGSTQTITNGIDLSGKGGLVWVKARSLATTNSLVDTVRGAGKPIYSNSATSQQNYPGFSVSAFGATGFTVTDNGTGDYSVNKSAITYASWTFREQAKFFDVVTYTGTGSNRTVSHNLGSVPGCIITKRIDVSGDGWATYHRSLGASAYISLNTTTASQATSTGWNDTSPTETTFSLGTSSLANASGGTYVAYLFAHDAGGFGLSGSDNVISCGSYTGNGSSTGPVITLGWEPQWVLIKNASDVGNWVMSDNMRNWSVTNAALLYANLSNAEATNTNTKPTATGFQPNDTSSSVNTNGATYIYIAIRRGPMKVPTSGTSVFSLDASSAGSSGGLLGAITASDLVINSQRDPAANSPFVFIDRLRGVGQVNTGATTKALYSSNTNAETTVDTTSTSSTADGVNGAYLYSSAGKSSAIRTVQQGSGGSVAYNFRRAPGFFDIVCYTGTGVARTINHNLAAVPELMIVRRRSSIANWAVNSQSLTASDYLYLNSTDPKADNTSPIIWNSTRPTSTVFSVGTSALTNENAQTFVAYLFATVAGVSKVGSYTGNGSSQTINCGFTAGARFVLIKRTDSTGNWLVADSARGIVAGNDPLLYLNSTAAEITTLDWIDADSSGFIVNQEATANANVSSATYIYFAVA